MRGASVGRKRQLGELPVDFVGALLGQRIDAHHDAW